MALTKLTQSLIDGTLVTSVNGNTGAVTTGIDLQSSVKTANFTAVANEGYLVNTTSSGITVTLPSSPSLGDEILIIDYAGTFGTNNVTLTSSNNILGSSKDYVIESNDVSVILIYTDATKGWKVKSGANEGTSAIAEPLVDIDYLIVAGGGGGGGTYHGGGGGAGGYRNSYNNEASGGGQGSETSLSLDLNTNYTVTIGAGGSGGYGANGLNAAGNSGSNSVFSTITSIGGGGGGSYRDQPSTGGSGGGSSREETAYNTGTGAAAVTTPVVHGYAGGDGIGQSGEPFSAGGGGGAGAVGANGSTTGGNGGNGLASSITGSSVLRGGGGGGSTYSATYTPGSGGTGGGGNASHSAGSSGTTNTGGGGGGSERDGGFYSGGDGGSGIVILRYPSAYTITVGAGLTSSTATDGSDKVTTFTAGTDSISFS